MKSYTDLHSLGNLGNDDIPALQAVEKCLKNNIPFAYFALPGKEKITFFANPSGKKSDECFIVSPWLTKYSDSIKIYRELSAKQVLDKDFRFDYTPQTWINNTDKSQYITDVANLIEKLKTNKGKTVISRVFTEQNVNIDFISLTVRRFSCYPDTFRFLYFTPQTGAWLGTSPELLLNYDKETTQFSTMSLAGTRKTDEAKSWDKKNIIEQDFVASYIKQILDNMGIDYDIKHKQDLNFYPVSHICDIISGKTGNTSFVEMLDKLNPTPALGGFPLDDALENIRKIELHPRKCYGGFIAYENHKKFTAHVNLRSVNFDTHSYCAYTGGGITENSIPEQEWAETENKCFTLLRDIDKCKF